MDRKNWVFSLGQLDHVQNLRVKTYPQGFTINDERELLNYYVHLSLELLKFVDLEEQLEILCYSGQIFKRFYFRNSLFQHSNLHQMCLNSLYLGLKLFERQAGNIVTIVERLKTKPKHQRKIHYGDEEYAKQELYLVKGLNYEIQVPQYYQTIQSVNNLLTLYNQLEPFLYKRYIEEIKENFIKSLFNDTIFLYNHGSIAIAICEQSLTTICNSLAQNQPNTTIGPSNRPVSQNIQNKLKQNFQNYLKEPQSLLLMQFVDKSTPQQVYDTIKENYSQIFEVQQVLRNTKDFPRQQGPVVLNKFENALNSNKEEFKRPEIKVKRNNYNAQPNEGQLNRKKSDDHEEGLSLDGQEPSKKMRFQ